MWVFSTFPPYLSLIGPLTTEIYDRTGITGNTKIHTDTQTETDTLSIYHIGSSKNNLPTSTYFDIQLSTKVKV